MKTERRHELRTNELGAFLLDANEWTRKYGLHFIGVIVIGVFAVLVVRYLQDSRTRTTDAALMAMADLSFKPEDADASFKKLDEVIASSGDRDLRMSALARKGLTAVNLALVEGQFEPKHLDHAEKAFNELMSAYKDRMPMVALALSGLASVEESRFVVDNDAKHKAAAKSYLERLQNEPQFKGTPFQTEAANRLLKLDTVFQRITLAEPLPVPPPPPVEAGVPQLIQVPPPTAAPPQPAPAPAPTPPPAQGTNSDTANAPAPEKPSTP